MNKAYYEDRVNRLLKDLHYTLERGIYEKHLDENVAYYFLMPTDNDHELLMGKFFTKRVSNPAIEIMPRRPDLKVVK